MAARKSCTHLSWADAKSKDGSDKAKKSKGGEKTQKKLNLTEKFIAKHSGVPQEEQKRLKAALKQQQRQEEKLKTIAEQKNAERRLQSQPKEVWPLEEARARHKLKANQLVLAPLSSTKSLFPQQHSNPNEQDLLLSCRDLQISEHAAVDSLFEEDDSCQLCRASLQHVNEAGTLDNLNCIAPSDPPFSYILRLEVLDEESRISLVSDPAAEITALLLLQVTLPPLYPLAEDVEAALPVVSIVAFECYDGKKSVNADKPYESLAHLDKDAFLNGLREQFTEVLPDLAVFEVCVSWTKDNLLQFCERR